MTVTPYIHIGWRNILVSKLDDAMLAHMSYIIDNEGPIFSYRDFISFKVNGKQYGMKHGTFRNKISKLKKKGKVIVTCRDVFACYTLTGVRLPRIRPMTPNHTGVNYRHNANNSLYQIVKTLPLKRQCIHDIRLRFEVPNIWKCCSTIHQALINEKSKDIKIGDWKEGGVIMRVVVHKTDVVTVMIGCTLNPFPLDSDGIIHLFNSLIRIEERLRIIVASSYVYNKSNEELSIPSYKNWIVTMWHFGRDAQTDYYGEKFSVTVENAQGILTRAYVKEIKNKKRIRLERQEYPQKSLEDAINERLFENIPLPDKLSIS